LKDADKDFIFNETEADLNKFDKLLMSSSPSFAFTSIDKKNTLNKMQKCNVDPLFNNAVDGLMYIRIEIFLKETSYGEFAGRKKIS
jgi:hypothetical protein